MDYSDLKTAIAAPEASSMIETFRAIGYSIETAVADIIDNSISAEAKNIWLDYEWEGSTTTLSILDDGIGMNNNELIQAMRPGSKNPLSKRRSDDLGRFGLGLKTASFSQSRKFTVVSKAKEYKPTFWSWDLDYVNQEKAWKLIRYLPNESNWIDKLNSVHSGTCVVWWDIDRLVGKVDKENKSAKQKFLKTMDSVKNHLSMVFHRFIQDGLNIYFRNRLIEPWDPFMIGTSALQARPETRLEEGKIKIRGFVMPHRSKLTAEEYDNGKGVKNSWTEHQGFYVYRNKRLLVAGDWLGMFKREAHYDLCRIRVDLSNHFDSEWQIDIKKSLARPPRKYYEHILSVAKDVRSQAVKVYRHKGQVIKRKLDSAEFSPLWEERTRHGKRFYKINRQHPLVSRALSNSGVQMQDIKNLIQYIEETVPVPLITIRESESEIPHGIPFEGVNHEAMIRTMEFLFKNFIEQGLSHERARARVLSIEPFSHYPEYVKHLSYE